MEDRSILNVVKCIVWNEISENYKCNYKSNLWYLLT